MPKLSSRVNDHDPGLYRQRFKRVFVIICLALFILVLRMWYLQVIKGDELTQRSETNSIRVCKIRPLRGLITDRHGTVLVDNQPSYDVVFIPDRNRDLDTVAARLQSFYREQSLPFADDWGQIERAGAFAPVRLDRNVDLRKLALVETRSLDLPGVGIDVVPIRQYLYAEMMAHLIGYVGEISGSELEKAAHRGYEPGDMVGKYGLEKAFDEHLKGENGAEEVEVNALGKKVKLLRKVDPRQGHSLRLTIDARLQQSAWEAFAGKRGAAVAMDVRTGDVLAMVSSPSFDPNLFNGGISLKDWRSLSTNPFYPMENRAISGQYPPGSTYKLVLAAAALEEGIVTPETAYHCDGTFHMGNRMFRCWKKEGHGRVNLHRAIVESCDVYFYHLGRQLGVDKLAHYARAFGFGVPTGVILGGEKKGLVPTKEWKKSRTRQAWQAGETISVAIGQGFNLATPLQLAVFYSALANGGNLYRPRLVDRVEGPDGRVLWNSVPEKRTRIPIRPENLAVLNRALWGAVNETGGTGYAARRPGHDVCGKTGTSQVVGLPEDEKARRAVILADRHRNHALFVGYAPYRNPEIVVSVIVEHGGSGGAVAAPIAGKIIDAYFSGQEAPSKLPPGPTLTLRDETQKPSQRAVR